MVSFYWCLVTKTPLSAHPEKTRLAKGSQAAPQLKELEKFGNLLKKGMLVAMRADDIDLHLEGKFWLALIEGEAFPAPVDMAVGTSVASDRRTLRRAT